MIRSINNKSSPTELFTIDENFQTPHLICEYMAEMIPKSAITILEPTPGIGNLVKAVKNRSDYEITTPDDFFLLDTSNRFDCIIMNPPFSSKSAFVKNAPTDAETKGMKLGYYILKQCMEMSDNLIALMPWYTISDSDVRMRHLREFGIKSLTPLPRKTFQYARIQTVIIELEKGYRRKTSFFMHKY